MLSTFLKIVFALQHFLHQLATGCILSRNQLNAYKTRYGIQEPSKVDLPVNGCSDHVTQ